MATPPRNKLPGWIGGCRGLPPPAERTLGIHRIHRIPRIFLSATLWHGQPFIVGTDVGLKATDCGPSRLESEFEAIKRDQNYTPTWPKFIQILQPFSNQICLHFHRRPLRKLLTRTEPSRVLHATHEIHWQLGASHRWSAPYELIPHGRFNLLPCCLPFRSFRIAEKMWENA